MLSVFRSCGFFRSMLAFVAVVWSSATFGAVPFDLAFVPQVGAKPTLLQAFPLSAQPVWDSLSPDLEALREKHERPEDYFQRQLTAAKQGNAAAQWRVANANAAGYGTAKDPAEASRYLRLSAQQRYPAAMNDLGSKLFRSDDPAAWTEAADLFNAAAEQGLAMAVYNQAVVLIHGRGAPKDLVKGILLLERAAEARVANAQLALGVRYFLGRDVPQDGPKAQLWLGRAHEQGQQWALYWLAQLHLQGVLIPKNEALALALAQDGIGRDLPEAMYLMGDMLLEGQGVAQDLAAGVRWMKQAASRDFGAAQYYISTLYLKGVGVGKDLQKSGEWAQKSAENGDDDGMALYGFMLYSGEGARMDRARALAGC